MSPFNDNPIVAFLALVLITVGGLSMVGGLVASIIYTIYQWAHELSFPVALWEGAVLWMKMLGGGLISLLLGLFIGAMNE